MSRKSKDRKKNKQKKKNKFEKMREKRQVKERVKPGETERKTQAEIEEEIKQKEGKVTEKEIEKIKWAREAGQDSTFQLPEKRRKLAARINHELGEKKKGKTIELAAGQVQNVKGSHAVDQSKEMLKEHPAEKRLKFDLEKLKKGEKLPYKEKSVDGAMMVYGINYIRNKEAVMNELERIMKEKGKVFFFGEPKGLSGVRRNTYNPEKLKEILEKKGFNVHTEEMFHGTIVEAGKKLDPEKAENRRKIFKEHWEKKEEQRKQRSKKWREIKEKKPEEYQSTTDYWRARSTFNKIEKKLQEKGIKAKIKPFDLADNIIKTKREAQTAPEPYLIDAAVVTKEEIPEKDKEKIKEIVDKELKKEFKDYDKPKKLKGWEKKDSGPFIPKVLSEKEYKKKREKARKQKEEYG